LPNAYGLQLRVLKFHFILRANLSNHAELDLSFVLKATGTRQIVLNRFLVTIDILPNAQKLSFILHDYLS